MVARGAGQILLNPRIDSSVVWMGSCPDVPGPIPPVVAEVFMSLRGTALFLPAFSLL